MISRIRLYITSVRKERDRLRLAAIERREQLRDAAAIKRKAIADLEADVERRLKFQGLSREDRRAVSRIERGMRVHG